MKIGVMSDIHSNVVALQVCMEYLQQAGCEEYLFLGDYITDTPYTRETMDYLYNVFERFPCHVLRGNREEYMLEQREAVKSGNQKALWQENSASGNLLFTYRRLTEKDLDFFEKLPITFRYEKQGYPAITCCHGSPVNSRESLHLDNDVTRKWLQKMDTDYMICAHTHYPGAYEYHGKTYFNAGSVGIAIGDQGHAQCLLLESVLQNGDTIWKPTFLKLPYDVSQVVKEIIESGLLEAAPWFINSNLQILLTGTDHSAELVRLANTLAEEAGDAGGVNIKEIYFETAAGRLGIPDYRKNGKYQWIQNKK